MMDVDRNLGDYSEVLQLLGETVSKPHGGVLLVERKIVLLDHRLLPANKDELAAALLEQLDLLDDRGHATDLKAAGGSAIDLVEMKRSVCFGYLSLAFFQDLESDPPPTSAEEQGTVDITRGAVENWVFRLIENVFLGFVGLAIGSERSRPWLAVVAAEVRERGGRLGDFCRQHEIAVPEVDDA